MSVQTWFFVMIFCVIVEIFTGTLFLLAIGGGALVGMLIASLGYGALLQSGSVAVCCCVFLAFAWSRRTAKLFVMSVTDFNQGERVQVIRWVSKSRARVSYRGSEWDAELVPCFSMGNQECNNKNIKDFFVHHSEGSVLFICSEFSDDTI